jgi:hypothetical protein
MHALRLAERARRGSVNRRGRARARQGAGLWKRLSQSFGYLSQQGYCTGGNTLGSPAGACHRFPTMLGETGSGMTVRVPHPTEAPWSLSGHCAVS